MTDVLRIGRRMEQCRVLGPGVRAVVWSVGCKLRCRECMTPEFLGFDAGEPVVVADLLEWLCGLGELDGLTLSGGEPFEQAEGFCELLDGLADVRPTWTTMAFTGYTLARLQRIGSPAQLALLERIDLLVAGPYVPERHSVHRWRGSSNQKIHALTDRLAAFADPEAESAGVEIELDPDGRFAITGVPPTRRFRGTIETNLRARGVVARTEQEHR